MAHFFSKNGKTPFWAHFVYFGAKQNFSQRSVLTCFSFNYMTAYYCARFQKNNNKKTQKKQQQTNKQTTEQIPSNTGFRQTYKWQGWISMNLWPLYSKLKMQFFSWKYWSFYSYSVMKNTLFCSSPTKPTWVPL